MSDAYRQDVKDKVGAYVKPDSKKTTSETVKDTVKGKVDDVAREVHPDGESKSLTQEITDAVSGIGKDLPDKDTVVEKVKQTIGLSSNSDKDSA